MSFNIKSGLICSRSFQPKGSDGDLTWVFAKCVAYKLIHSAPPTPPMRTQLASKRERSIHKLQTHEQYTGTSESGFLKFEKWKVKIKSFHSFSRSAKWKKNAFTLFREVQSEIKMLSLFFEKWKVKSKCFEIENEKWKFSRILHNSRETRLFNSMQVGFFFYPWPKNLLKKTLALGWPLWPAALYIGTHNHSAATLRSLQRHIKLVCICVFFLHLAWLLGAFLPAMLLPVSCQGGGAQGRWPSRHAALQGLRPALCCVPRNERLAGYLMWSYL